MQNDPLQSDAVEQMAAKARASVRTFNKQCENFKNGHWTLDMPQQKGVYQCRARNCTSGETKVVVYELNGEMFSTIPWGGYWWSEPLPDMPPTLDFEEPLG